MDVSTTLPPLIAAMLAPLPAHLVVHGRCHGALYSRRCTPSLTTHAGNEHGCCKVVMHLACGKESAACKASLCHACRADLHGL